MKDERQNMGSPHLDTCRNKLCPNYVPLAKTYLAKSDQSLLGGDNGRTSVGGKVSGKFLVLS